MPDGEDHQRHGDPSSSRRHEVSPHFGVDHGHIRSAHGNDTSTYHGIEIAQSRGGKPHGIHHPGRVSNGPERESRPCGPEKPGQKHCQSVGKIDQRILVEKCRAENGNFREERNRHAANAGNGFSDETSPEQRGKPRAEHGQRKAAHHLVRTPRDAEKGMHESEKTSREKGSGDAQPGVSRTAGDAESRKGPHEHEPLESQVENARSLRKNLPQRGVEDGCAAAHSGGKNGNEHLHVSSPPSESREHFGRNAPDT